jgi:hypothetical protein
VAWALLTVTRMANEDLRRTESALTDGIAHVRQVLAGDLLAGLHALVRMVGSDPA